MSRLKVKEHLSFKRTELCQIPLLYPVRNGRIINEVGQKKDPLAGQLKIDLIYFFIRGFDK